MRIILRAFKMDSMMSAAGVDSINYARHLVCALQMVPGHVDDRYPVVIV
jgi:hypothetical protein